MVFDWINVNTPFSWVFVAALFLSAAVARAMRYRKEAERWTLVYLYLSAAFAAAAGGLLVPGPAHFLDPRVGYFCAAVALVGFFGFRYKVVFGAPVLLLAVIALSLFAVGLEGWLPLEGGAAIAKVQVLGTSTARTDVEVTLEDGRSNRTAVTGTLPSRAIAPIVDTLRFSPFYFFMASPLLYRIDGLTSQATPEATVELPVSRSPTRGAGVVGSLPGVHRRRVVGQTIEAVALESYRVELSPRLAATITPISP